MSLHEQCVGATDEWYTPAYVFKALGCVFDLDVASPGAETVPWIPAEQHFDSQSLDREWRGFVWMNPPFGARNGLVPWLDKFSRHGDGICLVPDRTSAPWWQTWAAKMEAILFVAPKIKFIGIDGRAGRSPAQGTCLGAMGPRGTEALRRAVESGLGTLMASMARPHTLASTIDSRREPSETPSAARPEGQERGPVGETPSPQDLKAAYKLGRMAFADGERFDRPAKFPSPLLLNARDRGWMKAWDESMGRLPHAAPGSSPKTVEPASGLAASHSIPIARGA